MTGQVSMGRASINAWCYTVPGEMAGDVAACSPQQLPEAVRRIIADMIIAAEFSTTVANTIASTRTVLKQTGDIHPRKLTNQLTRSSTTNTLESPTGALQP